jgi:transposase-like protein
LAHVDEERVPGADALLVQNISKLGLEAGSEEYLRNLRWPDGVECPRCDSDRIGYIPDRRKHYCRDCAYQFRVTARTVLHDSHVPAARWLRAVGLLLAADRGFPATQLRDAIGGSYKTAWFVEHRIRSAMAQALQSPETAVPVARAARGRARVDSDTSVDDVGRTPDDVVAGLKLIRSLAAGDYHCPSNEHLSAYWAELRWRAEHADKDDRFRRTVKALLEAEPLPYAELVGHSV